MRNISIRNLIFFAILILTVFASQFILAGKQLEYGFYSDDWHLLGWYKTVVINPILDIPNTFKKLGPHEFVHAYYIGLQFQLFGLNYASYHIINTLLKSLAILSFFPVVYLLFKNRFLAILITFLYAVHFSPFGVIYHVIGGEGFLVVICLNLFLTVYIYASRTHILSKLKVLLLLLGLFLAAIFFEIPRAYPLVFLLPFLEFINLYINHSAISTKAIFFRLLFFYAPLIAIVAYSPSSLNEINFKKFKVAINEGNLQLFLTIFSSFGSTFVPQGLIDQLTAFLNVGTNNIYKDLGTFLNFLIFRFLAITIPVLITLKILVNLNRNWVLRCLLIIICFSFISFYFANHWLYLDPKLRAPVDPSTYFIPALIGLFVISTAISFLLREVIDREKNPFLLAISLAPIFSLIYIFLTWILVDYNSIFMGVHAYLNIPAMGSSIYLGTLFYLAVQKILSNKVKAISKFFAFATIIYFLIFVSLSILQIDKFFSYWLFEGFSARDQKIISKSFWNEVGREKLKEDAEILIYLDGSEDSKNGYFYSNALVWSIQGMLTVGKGQTYSRGGQCKSMIFSKDIDKLRMKIVNSQKLIVQNTCGYDIFYKPENFFAFKMINRDLVPIKEEILKQLYIK